MPNPIDERLLTVREIAKRIHISVYVVRRWIREGQLPVRYFIARRSGYRVAASDLDEFLNARTQQNAHRGVTHRRAS